MVLVCEGWKTAGDSDVFRRRVEVVEGDFIAGRPSVRFVHRHGRRCEQRSAELQPERVGEHRGLTPWSSAASGPTIHIPAYPGGVLQGRERHGIYRKANVFSTPGYFHLAAILRHWDGDTDLLCGEILCKVPV